ncbi:hypothetical protein BHYA_0015g00220 [Botrytis hyacinthi]|uniref:Uncharacterized protein n=1 Tax=Botrytis hyacinthi TaxID=278943 RepID=A0A4Z1H0Z7_9HELO|nr:hypothetical protein BHYA_0015g00220 [Botrytis hyacinthi]
MVPVVSAPKMSYNVKMIRDKTVGRVCRNKTKRPLPSASPKRRKLSQRTPAQARMAKGGGKEFLTMKNPIPKLAFLHPKTDKVLTLPKVEILLINKEKQAHSDKKEQEGAVYDFNEPDR